MTPRGKDRPERIFALLGDERLAGSESFRLLAKAHRNLLAARRSEDARRIESSLAECRDLAVPGIAAYYRNYAVRSAPSRGQSSA